MKQLARDVADHYGKATVRLSLLHFLFGKALNAIVSLLTIVVLAMWLSPADYGVYIAFLALQASLLAVSSLGIDTTAERFMPELRMRHPDSDLLGFVMAALAARLVSLAVMIAIGCFVAPALLELVGLVAYQSIFQIWLLVVALAGALAFSVVLLEAMLHQKQSQICMSAYVVIKLLLLTAAHHYTELDLASLVNAELVATGASAVFGLFLVIKRFSAKGLLSGWQIVVANRTRMRRFAFFNYVAQVVFQLFNAEVMKLLVTRMLGVLQLALYGFAYSLADTIQRYLPAVLLMRLIKPVFVSRYVKTGDFGQLNSMARIILKLNLFVLMPIIAFAALYGRELLGFLSQGKYEQAHWSLVSVLGLLVLTSHQQVLSLLASTMEKNSMQLYAGLASTVAFPCALVLIPILGPLGAIAASAVGGLTYNIFATIYLRRVKVDYRPDLRGGIVFLVAGCLLYYSAVFLNTAFESYDKAIALPMIIATTSLLYLVFVRALSAFSAKERDILNSILPKRIFVF